MPNLKHVIIYSHGFGVKKDDRGLFTDIAESLPKIESIMFDYNDVDDENNQLTVKPFSAQAKMLSGVVSNARKNNPEAIIDLICHSQGAIAAALANPGGIRMALFLAPPASASIERTINNFKKRQGTKIDMQGISKLARADGSMTIVPPEYWAQRQDTNVIDLYKKLSNNTNLVIINAKQDEILDGAGFDDLKNAEIINIDGGHNFEGGSRIEMIKIIKNKIL